MKHRIYIVEDNELVRGTLGEFIEMATDLRVCGMAASAEAALEELPDAAPDLLVIDVSLPGMSGIELVGEAKARWPEMPCLMLSGHQEPAYARRALETGARGYVLKGEPGTISDAIRAVLDGATYVSAQLQHKLSG